MKKKTASIMKGIGVAMAVGSVVAGASASMGMGSQKTKKTMKKAIDKVADLVDTVSAVM